jgi:hypothetical protein
MLLEVATPMHMIVPINAGTLMVVRVRNSIQAIPVSAPGSAVMMMNGSSQLGNKYMGEVEYPAVSVAIARFQNRLKTERALQRRVKQIEKLLKVEI